MGSSRSLAGTWRSSGTARPSPPALASPAASTPFGGSPRPWDTHGPGGNLARRLERCPANGGDLHATRARCSKEGQGAAWEQRALAGRGGTWLGCWGCSQVRTRVQPPRSFSVCDKTLLGWVGAGRCLPRSGPLDAVPLSPRLRACPCRSQRMQKGFCREGRGCQCGAVTRGELEPCPHQPCHGPCRSQEGGEHQSCARLLQCSALPRLR